MTKNRIGVSGIRKAGRKLPNDACPTCGTIMKTRRGPIRFPVNGERITVPSVTYLKCPKCGEAMFDFDEVGRMEEVSRALYRKKHSLLAPEEILAIRKHYGLTQGDLARLLRLGANTISRWESGRNVQTGAMDILLRLIRDLPGSLEYLRKNAA